MSGRLLSWAAGVVEVRDLWITPPHPSSLSSRVTPRVASLAVSLILQESCAEAASSAAVLCKSSAVRPCEHLAASMRRSSTNAARKASVTFGLGAFHLLLFWLAGGCGDCTVPGRESLSSHGSADGLLRVRRSACAAALRRLKSGCVASLQSVTWLWPSASTVVIAWWLAAYVTQPSG